MSDGENPSSPPFEPDPAWGRKRNSAKALVSRGGSLLVTVNRDGQGLFHLLPGGGQRLGETLVDTVRREVLEETGWIVEPGGLVLVRDYIGSNHEFAEQEGDVHQTELVFEAEPLERRGGRLSVPDAWQVGIDWIPIERIGETRMYPSVLAELLPLILRGEYEGPVYLGDVN